MTDPILITNEPTTLPLKARLRRLRHTQATFGLLVGVHQQSISRWSVHPSQTPQWVWVLLDAMDRERALEEHILKRASNVVFVDTKGRAHSIEGD